MTEDKERASSVDISTVQTRGPQLPPANDGVVRALSDLRGALQRQAETQGPVPVVRSETLRLPVSLSAVQIASLPSELRFALPLPTPSAGLFASSVPSVDVAPDCWLALGLRYALHLGTCWVWDTWGAEWCSMGWRPKFNTPRVAVVGDSWGVRAGGAASTVDPAMETRDWVNLWTLIGPWVKRPTTIPADGWCLSFTTEQAHACLAHERRYGTRSAPVNAATMVWVRRGRPDYKLALPFAAGWAT